MFIVFMNKKSKYEYIYSCMYIYIYTLELYIHIYIYIVHTHPKRFWATYVAPQARAAQDDEPAFLQRPRTSSISAGTSDVGL